MGERYQAWVDNVQSLALDLRRNNPAFLIDQFRKKGMYADIVNRIGTPLMVNNKEQYSKVPAQLTSNYPIDMDVEFFPALGYLLNLYESGQKKCPMQTWCRDSKINTDCNRDVNPLKRANPSLYPMFCPVGGLWYSWGMKDYIIRGLEITK